jgi:hypothetical protein
LLTEAAREQEGTTEKPYRQPNAEFDAMKARLVAGVVPDPRDYTPRSIEGSEHYYWEPVQLAMKRTPLPAVTSSFFRADEPLFAVALRPFGLDEQGPLAIGLADALSAVHRVPFRMRVLAPAGYYYGGPIGIWDISSVGMRFEKPVVLHAVAARGGTTGLEVSSVRGPIGEQPCSGPKMSVVGKRQNAQWTAASLAWAGKPAASTPAVTATQIGGNTKYERLTVESVDLNGDKIPDFVAWTGLAEAVVQAEIPWKAVFANVEGKWLLVALAQGLDCT